MQRKSEWRYTPYVMTKMYQDAKGVICETLEDAQAFLKECALRGFKWYSGADIATETNWYTYGEETVFILQEINNVKRILYTHVDALKDIQIIRYCRQCNVDKSERKPDEVLRLYKQAGLTEQDLHTLIKLMEKQ